MILDHQEDSYPDRPGEEIRDPPEGESLREDVRIPQEGLLLQDRGLLKFPLILKSVTQGDNNSKKTIFVSVSTEQFMCYSCQKDANSGAHQRFIFHPNKSFFDLISISMF